MGCWVAVGVRGCPPARPPTCLSQHALWLLWCPLWGWCCGCPRVLPGHLASCHAPCLKLPTHPPTHPRLWRRFCGWPTALASHLASWFQPPTHPTNQPPGLVLTAAVQTVETVLRLAHSAEAMFDYTRHHMALEGGSLDVSSLQFAWMCVGVGEGGGECVVVGQYGADGGGGGGGGGCECLWLICCVARWPRLAGQLHVLLELRHLCTLCGAHTAHA